MKAVNISICSCKKYNDRNAWKPYKHINEVILKKVRDELPKAKVVIKDISLPESNRDKRESYIVVKTKDNEEKVKVAIKLTKCNLCEKEGTKYFEAILQIRSPSLEVLESSVEFLNARVDNLRHRGLFINKLDRFEDGFDLFMTNNKMAQALGRELVDTFGGRVKISPRLFSKNHQTSKDIYRVNVFAELPSFSKGDTIVLNDKVYRIEKLGKKIKLSEMVSGSVLIEDYAKMDYTVLKKQQTYVSRAYPTLEVINPHDYQSSMVKNKPKLAFTTGQQINVVIHKGIYVVE